MHALLIGNPNCGKTTLFNALTGLRQCIGNWPGVTVEKKTGSWVVANQTIQLTDLPGIYSLTSFTSDCSQDEQIAANALINLPFDLIINVVDACHLERHLYLTSQILELGKPVIVVLTMMDLAKQQSIVIDTQQLAKQLDCPVIPLQVHKRIGLSALEQVLMPLPAVPKAFVLQLPSRIKEALSNLEQHLQAQAIDVALVPYYARRLMENNRPLAVEQLGLTTELIDSLVLSEQEKCELDIVCADARYQSIHDIVLGVQKKRCDAAQDFTAKLDKIVLNRYGALPIFFALMYLMFLFAINIGGAFQDFFSMSSDAIFVHGTAWLLTKIHAPAWLISLLAHGIGKGISTTLTFIPVIGAMFFALAFLEASGYMARAAFVVDKLMRLLGLPGKAFVPMIVGFGCNVPAIMAARTLDSEKERLLTILMTPFMSCSARLAIYAVFVAAFFPHGGQNVVFSLYLIGIVMAVLTGFVLRRTYLGGKTTPLILELPTYHKPALGRLCKEAFLRLRHFIFRAGRLIIPVSVVLSSLHALTLNNQSVLSLLGQWLTPLFAPMGIQQDNWPATVGLLTGVLAKEVVIGALNAMYTELDKLPALAGNSTDFLTLLKTAAWSIPNNLFQLGSSLLHPLVTSAAKNPLMTNVYGTMQTYFTGAVGAYAYLLFILLYVPCVSTMAVIRQEASRYFMWFSIVWSLLIAYTAAVLFYQLATFATHPQQSLLWFSILVIIISAVAGFLMRGKTHVIANP